MRQLLAACVLTLCMAASAAAEHTVFIVRHAERADGGSPPAGMTAAPDPDLSEAGHARARALAATLKDAGITAIFTTEFKRTSQTAEPLAKALGIEIVRVTAKDAAGLAARVRAATGNVLVVGHSNTVPELVKAVGATGTVTIGDQDFDNLFVVSDAAGKATVVRLHYR